MEGQPTDKACQNCSADNSSYKRIQFGDTIYCLNCVCERITDVQIDYVEELLFEGNIDISVYDDEVVEVTTTNEFGTCLHEFPITLEKKEQFSQGNPNTAEPGHKGFIEQNELRKNTATVTVLEPEKTDLDHRSDYFLNLVKKELE